MFMQPQATTLIVVYKDEMLSNQLKKLVETNDDTAEGIVGIKDGSVEIVAWNEKTWLAQKKAGNITSKVLYLGDIKGTDKLKPVIDEKFDKFGVKFGWAGKQAIIYADDSAIKDYDEFIKFANELNTLPVSNSLKVEIKENPNSDEPSKGNETTKEHNEALISDSHEEISADEVKVLVENKIKNYKDVAVDGLKYLVKKGAGLPQSIKEKNEVKAKLMLYGIIKFYYEGLDDFINS